MKSAPLGFVLQADTKTETQFNFGSFGFDLEFSI